MPRITFQPANAEFSRLLFVLLICAGALTGCNKLGIGTGGKDPAAIEGDARATGSACRQAGRALEDCFTLNPASPRSAIFSGWKEMSDYMRDNKIDNVKPELTPPQPPPPPPAGADDANKDSSKADDKADAKDEKTDDKPESKSSKKDN